MRSMVRRTMLLLRGERPSGGRGDHGQGPRRAAVLRGGAVPRMRLDYRAFALPWPGGWGASAGMWAKRSRWTSGLRSFQATWSVK